MTLNEIILSRSSKRLLGEFMAFEEPPGSSASILKRFGVACENSALNGRRTLDPIVVDLKSGVPMIQAHVSPRGLMPAGTSGMRAGSLALMAEAKTLSGTFLAISQFGQEIRQLPLNRKGG